MTRKKRAVLPAKKKQRRAFNAALAKQPKFDPKSVVVRMDKTLSSIGLKMADLDALIEVESRKLTPWRFHAFGYRFTDGTVALIPCLSLNREGRLWWTNGWAVALRGEFLCWTGTIAVGRWTK